MHQVTSSQIKSIGYNKETGSLFIEFKNGTVYEYYNVPIETYNAFLVPTISVGAYFQQKIKSNVSQLYSRTKLHVEHALLVGELSNG